MKGHLLAVLLFAGAALAGCAGQPGTTTTSTTGEAPFDPATLSQPVYAKLPPVDVAIPSGVDGKRMDAAVYRPDVPNGTRVPVFINFSPYWGDTAMGEGDNFGHYMVDRYVPRGFAVVLSAVRGTGHSEGCFQVGGDVELQDTRDVIDYFAHQPWSNGNVAAGGKSYDSTTQNGVIAKFPTPNLKGIFHVEGITDMYAYNAKDGVVYTNGLSFTPQYAIGQGTDEYGLPTGTGGGSSGDESPTSLARLADDAACPELAKHVGSGEGTAADGLRDAYWAERDWPAYVAKSNWTGSIFFVHGFQDWNVKPDAIDPWVDEWQAKGNHVLGWLHQETYNLGHVYPMRTDWNETMDRWMDGVLKGKQTRLDQLWGFDVAGSDKTWRHSSTWPPAKTGEAVVALGKPTEKTTAVQRVAGVPYATVSVQPTGPDDVARLVLYDQGDGKTTFVDTAVRRLALSDDLSAPRTLAPGMSVQVNMTFYPIDWELAPGHQWLLQVGVASPAAMDDSVAGFFWRPDQVTPGPDYEQVQVHLPLADAGGVLDPQPTHMACFTC